MEIMAIMGRWLVRGVHLLFEGGKPWGEVELLGEIVDERADGVA